MSNNGIPISRPIQVGTQIGLGSVRVKNRELVLESLLASGAGTMYISPTNKYMFPWLAPLASGYEKYKFKRVSFLYRSTAATTSSGLVYTAIDYDPSDVDVN